MLKNTGGKLQTQGILPLPECGHPVQIFHFHLVCQESWSNMLQKLNKNQMQYLHEMNTVSYQFRGFLAHLVMSLCNHALSVMCRCRCHHHLCHQRPCHRHLHLCTALPVTALIIETSYLANICSYTPSICT